MANPAKLWHTKRTVDSVAATDEDADFPASNLLLESIEFEWRSVGTGAKTVDLVLPAPVSVELLYLHAINFAAATVKYSDDGVVFSAGEAFTGYGDIYGRYRGPMTIAQPVVKAIRIEIAAGATTDDAAFKRIGAAYVMATAVDVAGCEWGYRAQPIIAEISTTLTNKKDAIAVVGTDFDDIAVSYKLQEDEDIATVLRQAGQGTCIWTPNIPQLPHEIWPVRLRRSTLGRARNNLQQEDVQFVLREQV